MHVQQEVQGHLGPEEDLDGSQVEFRDISVLEGAFGNRVDHVIRDHILLDVGAFPGLLLDDFFLLVDHEVGGAFLDCSRLEVEGPEHAEVRSSHDVDLVVVEFGIKGEFTLSDGLFVQIPKESVVDDVGLGVDCISVVFGSSCVHDELVSAELPELDDGDLHASHAIGLIERSEIDLERVRYNLVSNYLSIVHYNFVLLLGVSPDISRTRIDLPHNSCGIPGGDILQSSNGVNQIDVFLQLLINLLEELLLIFAFSSAVLVDAFRLERVAVVAKMHFGAIMVSIFSNAQ